MPEKEADYLKERLAKTKCLLEFGSGGSTIAAAEIGVKEIHSVDSDAAFLSRVVAYVSCSYPSCDLHVYVLDIGATATCGYPESHDRSGKWAHYFSWPWEALKRSRSNPDLVLVDGRFRVACFWASLLNARPGTLILFDDYAHRRHYHCVERVLKPIARVGRLGVFRVPFFKDRSRIAMRLAAASHDPR